MAEIVFIISLTKHFLLGGSERTNFDNSRRHTTVKINCVKINCMVVKILVNNPLKAFERVSSLLTLLDIEE